MNGIGSKYSMRTALLVSSVIFAVIHGLNPGMSLILWINLVLIAIFFGLYIICFDNIFGACAIHSVWNFAQVCFYGISVSGTAVCDCVFDTIIIPGKEFINGGILGAEGGTATTIVTVLSIGLLLVYMNKTGRIVNKATEDSNKSKQQQKV